MKHALLAFALALTACKLTGVTVTVGYGRGDIEKTTGSGIDYDTESGWIELSPHFAVEWGDDEDRAHREATRELVQLVRAQEEEPTVTPAPKPELAPAPEPETTEEATPPPPDETQAGAWWERESFLTWIERVLLMVLGALGLVGAKKGTAEIRKRRGKG